MSTLTLLGIDIETLPRKISVDPPLTDEEFESLCLKTDIVQLERTKEGVILMHSPTGAFTGDANAEIIRQLRNWWITHCRGRVFDSNTGFFLPTGAMLSPDAAFVRPEKLEGLIPNDYEHFLRLCPDFVIELKSRSDSLPELKLKMEAWVENGIELGWLIDPYSRKVFFFGASGVDLGRLFNSSAIYGTGPVQGFTLDLAEVWRCYEV